MVLKEVFLVDGWIVDHSDPNKHEKITLGIFTSLNVAQKSIEAFIGHSNFHFSENCYSIPSVDQADGYEGPIYTIKITMFELNQIKVAGFC